MKLLTLATSVALLSTISLAKEPRTPEQIFAKKCAMCHTVGKPESKMERMEMVGPPITMAMSGVVITIDAVDGPFKDEELRKESIAFLKDYLYNPTAEKTNCEDQVVEKFGRMPSLKGFLSPEELDVVVPWVYDTFKPIKVNGEYVKTSL
jgi:hypothetical protein